MPGGQGAWAGLQQPAPSLLGLSCIPRPLCFIPTRFPHTSIYSPLSLHLLQHPLCIPLSSTGHKGNLGQVPVNLRATPVLVMSDGTIPFPELRPISSRALGCGGPGKVFLTWLSAAGGECHIPSHLTVRAVHSGRLGWALCPLPSTADWLYHQLGWEHSVRPWWSSWGWFGMKPCSPSPHAETSHQPP